MAASAGLTPTAVRLVWAITVLSVAHHVDHLLRDVTGWPVEDEVNPFTISLLVYPMIAVALFLSRRGRFGPRSWAALAGGGALFILAVHVGPVAGDSVTRIPLQYDSALAAVAALVVLVAFFCALVAHCLYELRTAAQRLDAAGPDETGARTPSGSLRG
ncbi:MAG: hypothetical protein ACRD03_11200 [Acidimicrobiales bacterium]